MTPDAYTPSYVPDDAGITPEALEFLQTQPGARLRQAVLELLATHPTPAVADIARLRKTYPPHALHAALTMGQLQAKAHLKFPDLPWCWCVPEALEQASSLLVARHKAARFAALGSAEGGTIADLCTGLGGDALALAESTDVLAVDLSPVRLTCAQLNAAQMPPTSPPHRLTTQAADIADLIDSLPADTRIHIDPSRRSGGKATGGSKRSAYWEDLIPGPTLLHKVIAKFHATALKLSPAVDFPSLPPGHIELISQRRSVVQAVLWCGAFTQTLPPHLRTATILDPTEPPYSITGEPRNITTLAPANAFLYEIDGALTRSNLAAEYAAQHSLQPLTADGGYLTGPLEPPLPAAQAFRVLETLRYSEQRVLEALRRHATTAPAGPVEVKTRGGLDLDTDQLQRRWTSKAPVALTVLICRDPEGNRQAILAQRLKDSS